MTVVKAFIYLKVKVNALFTIILTAKAFNFVLKIILIFSSF